MSVTSPSILLKNNTFNGECTFIKTTASTNSYNYGGNVFNAAVTIENQDASRAFRFANDAGDHFNGEVIFTTGSNNIQVAYKGNSYFAGDITINNNKVVFNASSGKVILTGTQAQTIGGGAAYAISKLEINKDGGNVQLDRAMTIDSSITFVNGIISTDSVITLKAATTCNGASNQSFVDGPVKKIGNTAFVFPVGALYGFFPLSMSPPSNSTDAFQCEYINRNHGETSNSDSTIGYLSTCGYWLFNRITGSSNVKIRVYWDSLGCGVFDTTNLTIANWNGTLWKDLGKDSIFGNKFTGSILSKLNVQSFQKIVWAQLSSTTVITAQLSASTRTMQEDFFGYNGNNTTTCDDAGNPIQSWQILADVSSRILSRTSITHLRFPPGRHSNYVDWKTGYPIIEKDLPFGWKYLFNEFKLPMNRVGNEPAYVAQNLEFIAARPLITLNLMTSKFEYEAASLYRYNEVNLAVRYVEFGNEFYLGNEQYKEAFPSVDDYSIAAEGWAMALKSIPAPGMSNLKIACVGSKQSENGPGRQRLWLDKLLNNLPPNHHLDAITIHDYTFEGTTNCPGTSVPNAMQEQFLTIPFNERDELKTGAISTIQNYNLGHSHPFEIWVTEFNLDDGDDIRLGTWMHGLYNAAMSLTYLETDEIAKVTTHTMLSDAVFGNIFENSNAFDPVNCHGLLPTSYVTRQGEFTALGTSLDYVARAIQNATTAQQIEFPNAHLLVDANNIPTQHPALYGWLFNKPNGHQAILILNLCAFTQVIDLFTNVLNGQSNADFNSTLISANDLSYAILGDAQTVQPGIDDLNELRSESPNWLTLPGSIDAVDMPPFSLLYLESNAPYDISRLTDDEICTGSSTTLVVENNLTSIAPTCTDPNLSITGPIALNAQSNHLTYQVSATAAGIYTISPCSTCTPVTLTVHENISNLAITSSNYTINAQNQIIFCPAAGSADIQLSASCTSPNAGSLSWIWAPAVDSGLVSSACAQNTPFCNQINVHPEKSTTYTVYVTDQSCWQSTSVTVIVPVDHLSLGDDIRVCNGTDVDLVAEFTTAAGYSYTYDWSIDPGATGSTISIDHSLLSVGINNIVLTIAASGTSLPACTSAASIQIEVIDCCPITGTGIIGINPIAINDGGEHPVYYNHADNLANECYGKLNIDVTYTSAGAGDHLSARIECFPGAATILINGEFKVLANVLDPSNNLLVDGIDMEIVGCNVEFGPKALIEVSDRRTLTLNNCNISACGNEMWEGILLDRKAGRIPAHLVINNCILKDAVHAINITRNSEYAITNNTFEDNYIDIFIFKDPMLVNDVTQNNFLITGNIFTRSNSALLPPFYQQVKHSAFYLYDTERPRIGIIGTPADQNTIEKSIYGVFMVNSGAEIYNNNISNLTYSTSGKVNSTPGSAIYLKNDFQSSDRLLRVGAFQAGNTFTSCKNGVYGVGEADYLIQQNTFGINSTDEDDHEGKIETTCIRIENNKNNEIEIGAENEFNDFNRGISLYDLGEDVTLDIHGNNFFDAIWGRNISYYATAISLMNPLPVYYSTQPMFKDNIIGYNTNDIFHARIGISLYQASNIRVEGNRIRFHYDVDRFGSFCGIQAINSQDCRIIDNRFINTISGNQRNHLVTGIRIQESVTPRINCNIFDQMGFGLHAVGDNGAVILAQNEFTTYDQGISLGWGPSTPASIGQIQGSPTPSPDGTGYLNEWDGTSAFRVDGFTGLPISWYHNGLSDYSNLNAPVDNLNSTMFGLTPLENADEGAGCDPETWLWQRMSGYSSLAFDSLRLEGEYATQLLYSHQQSFYKFCLLDSARLEGTGTDTMYRHIYNQLDTTNIGVIQRIIKLAGHGNIAPAYELLETLQDTNYYESNLKTVLTIYLQRVLNDSILNAEDSSALSEIAYQHYLIAGEAVFLARAMLQLEIEDGPLGDARIKKPTQSVKQRILSVHPNPATDLLLLTYTDEDLVERILLTDPSGREILNTGYTKTFSLTSLKPGLYFVTLHYSDGENLLQKFIKLK
ncbi:MAG: T9SS type A sorting domain-containing protein [Bacteroidia bacterium]